MIKHKDSKLRFGELLPVSVAFKTSHTALEADSPGYSGTKQEAPFTQSTLESHSLSMINDQLSVGRHSWTLLDIHEVFTGDLAEVTVTFG